MDTAKRVDDMFGVQQSNVHTIRDAKHDIEKIMSYLLSEKAEKYNPSREGDQFHDPRITGWAKVAEGYLDSYLKGEIEAEEQMQGDSNDGNIDFNYELYSANCHTTVRTQNSETYTHYTMYILTLNLHDTFWRSD